MRVAPAHAFPNEALPATLEDAQHVDERFIDLLELIERAGRRDRQPARQIVVDGGDVVASQLNRAVHGREVVDRFQQCVAEGTEREVNGRAAR